VDKPNRADKNDGVVALVMALDRWVLLPRAPTASAARPPAREAPDAVFAAYGRRGRDCGRWDVPLEVHHVNGDPADNRIANTIPLCRDCHHEATFPGI
jgi:hypothetical protein